MHSKPAVLDHPLIAERYFYPVQSPIQAPYEIEVAGGVVLHCYLRRVNPSWPTLLHFHGNGEVVANYLGAVLEAFTSLGVNVLLAEYRGYGGSSGRPAMATMLDDVEAIFARLGLPEEQIIAFGRSVGSLYAVELAYRHPRIGGLILESGIADVLERLLFRVEPEELDTTRAQLEDEVSSCFDQQAKLAEYRGPLLVMHTEHDGIVDVSHARRLHAWSGGSVKDLVVFPTGDHNTIMFDNWPLYWNAVRDFVEGLSAVRGS